MPAGFCSILSGAFALAAILRASPASAALTFTIDAPPSLAAAGQRIRAIDTAQLAQLLARAGLEVPRDVRVTLIPEDDPRARETSRWIVGRAFGTHSIAIFPGRVTYYPYDSVESVVRHEVVHLALNVSAGLRPLPRWFHEGVATSVEGGWNVDDGARLLVAMVGRGSNGIADVDRLFESGSQDEVTRAYLLAGALVSDLRERHGGTLPGRIAERVRGMPFAEAFQVETGGTPDAAAERAWSRYTRWTNWIPVATSSFALWLAILAVATLAFVARRRRRARQRRQWDQEEEAHLDAGPG